MNLFIFYFIDYMSILLESMLLVGLLGVFCVQFMGVGVVVFKVYPCWHKVQEEPSELQIWQLEIAEVQVKQDVPDK